MGQLARVRLKADAHQLRDRIDQARDSERNLDAQIGKTKQEMKRLRDQQVARNEWIVEHAPEIRKYDALTREFGGGSSNGQSAPR
jgi:predicted  nucleic acid-binding Zn-ribbon protein